MPDRITVLIVDDSRLFRAALEESLAEQGSITVVGSVFSGEKALEFIRNNPPDIVTLDVEMPGMGGLATLEQIQRFNSDRPGATPVGVIMVSALTRRGADVTVKALQTGALDFVTKPTGSSSDANIAALRDELSAKISACARRRKPPATGVGVSRSAAGSTLVSPLAGRRASNTRAVVVGASTGGPRVLSSILPELCELTDLPILIVQHMPPDFTRSLAESLARQTRRTVVEATDGDPLRKEAVFIAPGGRHLLLRGPATSPIMGLTNQPPENGCRPSVDVLFRSAAAVLRNEVVAVILTGMGCDGTAGLGVIRRAGGYIIAQDEATSVVWGMPGSAVEAGLTDEVLPANRIARAIAAAVGKTTPGA